MDGAQRYAHRAGVFTGTTIDAAISYAVSPDQMKERGVGRYLTRGNPLRVFHLRTATEPNGADIAASVAFDAFLKLPLPELC